jgi:adenosylhomocysteinase
MGFLFLPDSSFVLEWRCDKKVKMITMFEEINKNIRDSKDLAFKYFSKRIKKRDVHFLFVIHLTRTIEVYISDWLENFKSVGIISIPYSEIPEVKEKLSKKTEVYSPADVSEVPDLISKICIKNREKKICMVEIGGYSSLLKAMPENIVGSVEDTNQGHWNFKKNESRLTFPVMSIAQTNLKKIENKFVGSSIGYSLEKFLREHFNRDLITVKDVLVMGYGEIGRGTARKLKSTLANVYIYDSDPVNMMLARLDGFNITDRTTAISQADIIVGASGRRSLEMSDVPYLKNNALLVSASSKQVEFPIEDFKESMISSSDYMSTYKNGEAVFHIAYQGFPINFIDDSAFGEIFDMVMSSLLLAANSLLESNLLPKVYDLEPRLQQEVARKYLEFYEIDNYNRVLFSEEIRKKRHDAASALIVSKNHREDLMILLLNHHKIGKWIPIGGHVERFESLESAVIRELEEEIGISPIYWFDKNFRNWSSMPVVFGEKLEEIPSPDQREPHFHRDFIYLAIIDYRPVENFTGKMKDRVKWVKLEEALEINPNETTEETLELMNELKNYKENLLG